MKNNYKQLMSTPPTEHSSFKRSASHSLRSSFRLPKKRNNIPTTTISCSSLPTTFIPRKAAALLDISLPPTKSFSQNNSIKKLPEPVKVATIRRRSVWANSSASKVFEGKKRFCDKLKNSLNN